MLKDATTEKKVNTQQVGRSGELLVQYKLLKHGIDSAPMTTDRGVDLVAIDSNTQRTVSIQIKTASHHYQKSWIGWAMPKNCSADYVAVVDLVRDKCWLLTKADFDKHSTGKRPGGGRWLWWYVPEYKARLVPNPERTEANYDPYAIDAVIPKLF